MECEFPFAATPLGQRREALEAYLEGEALCDHGENASGTRRLRDAFRLAWEVSSEEWPQWALALRREILGEPCVVVSAAPLLADVEAALNWQPEIGATWSVTGVAAALRSRSVAVLDALFDRDDMARAREELRRASQNGMLHPARVGAVADGPTAQPSSAIRSDRIAWVHAAEDCQWQSVRVLAARLDALVRELRSECDELLGDVRAREKIMVAAYGPGDAFAKHADNHCVLGSHRSGSHCTSRVLSAVLYLAPSDWRPGSAAGCDGGSLRIYRPAAAAAAHRITPDLADEEDNDVLVEIAPIEGRLVLFLSDLRCPHEVLPVLQAGRERYSMITWFTNTIEDGGSVV